MVKTLPSTDFEKNVEGLDTNLGSSSFSQILQRNINSPSLQHAIEGVILALLTLSVYLLTANPVTQPIALYVYLACFSLLGIVFVIQVKKEHSVSLGRSSRAFKIVMFALITGILLWVASTGWFLSPFSYLLYLVGISLAFLFSSSVAFTFVLLLVGVLLPNIGSLNAQLDITSLLSLLFIIPLSYFLRREYLVKVEKEKKILILEKKHVANMSKVEEVLSNKVTKMAVDLREPINDVLQLALYAQEHPIKDEKKYLERTIAASKRAIDMIKTFEEETTGRILVKNLE